MLLLVTVVKVVDVGLVVAEVVMVVVILVVVTNI